MSFLTSSLKQISGSLLLLTLVAELAEAQSTISTVDRHAYSANAGWIDFRVDFSDGVSVSESCLSGKAHAANFGWIDLGDGSPDNGYSYSNTTATDYGVNLSSTGALTGFAYAANIGWIQFEQTHGKPALSFTSGQFSGHAYSANVGWIALDTSFSNLVTTTLHAPDVDHDGIGDSYEMRHFGNLTTVNATSDHDRDGHLDVSEYLANTNPDDSSDYLRIVDRNFSATFTSVVIHFTSKPNRLYRVEHNTDLGPVWVDSNLGTFPPHAGTTTISDVVNFANGPRRFFRVVARRPLQP